MLTDAGRYNILVTTNTSRYGQSALAYNPNANTGPGFTAANNFQGNQRTGSGNSCGNSTLEHRIGNKGAFAVSGYSSSRSPPRNRFG